MNQCNNNCLINLYTYKIKQLLERICNYTLDILYFSMKNENNKKIKHFFIEDIIFVLINNVQL